jgi:hypothetical protein
MFGKLERVDGEQLFIVIGLLVRNMFSARSVATPPAGAGMSSVLLHDDARIGVLAVIDVVATFMGLWFWDRAQLPFQPLQCQKAWPHLIM